jgi:hypothetical protein
VNDRFVRSASVLAGLVAIGAAIAAVVPIPLPLTDPPLSAAISNKVTDFGNDHPEFAPLRDGRKDATGIKFPHDKHLNNPGGVNAKDWKGQDRALNCLDCHESDDQGRYFKPVAFADHCAVCHSSNLGQIEVAEGVVKAAQTPHGDERAIAAVVDAQVHQWIALNAAKPAAAPGAVPAEEAKPASGGGRRGGRGGGDAAPKKAALPELKSEGDLSAFLVEQRDKQFKDLAKGTKCGYCHTVDKPDTKGSPFVVKNPVIPDRWLTRSVFSHQAHGMVSCTSCHNAEKSSTSADINLPNVASCRECHAPMSESAHGLGERGAGDSCVMCHVYHPKNAAPVQGKLSPKDLMRK